MKPNETYTKSSDSDLEDLIDGSRPQCNGFNKNEMENLTKTHPPSTEAQEPTGICSSLCALIVLFASTTSNVIISATSIFIALVIFLLVHHLVIGGNRVSPNFSEISTDYSGVESVYDLSLGNIDHWCLFGGDDGCACDDPLEAMSRGEERGWLKAHKMNKMLVKEAIQTETDIDVVFLGDSLVEEMDGRWVGEESKYLLPTREVFASYFSMDAGGSFEGLPLGIAGDSSTNLLWRIFNGEVPDDFNPRIWWVVIGLNDLAKFGCSEEVALLGILRVVEELLQRKPNSKIVINSLLPTWVTTYKREGHPTGVLGSLRLDEEPDRRRNVVPLYPAVQTVNEQLQLFSEKHAAVEFLDVTGVFFEDNENEDLRYSMFRADRIHLTAEGYEFWVRQIWKQVRRMTETESSDTDRR